MAKNKTTQANVDAFTATSLVMNEIKGILDTLKQPMNQNPNTQEKYLKELEFQLEQLYKNTKENIKKGVLKGDATGILTNEMVFTESAQSKKQYPHHHDVKRIIANIIKNDPEANAMTTVNQTPATTPVNTTAETNAMTTTAPVTPEAPATTVTPIAAAVNPTTPAVPVAPTPVVEQTVDFATAFHTPYFNKIDAILLEMNDALGDDEIKPLRKKLMDEIRVWVDESYKSLHDLNNPNRLLTDTVGLLEGKTKYSSGEYASKFDHAGLVDQIINQVNKKYKNTDTGVSVHAMTSAISGAQDETKDKFVVPTDENGQKLIVDKRSKDIKAVNSKGEEIGFFKKMYNGVKAFFTNILNQFKRLGAWIKSWFVASNDEQPADLSPSEFAAAEAAAKARAAQAA